MLAGLLGRKESLLDHALDHVVIASELVQIALAKEIRARIPNVADNQSGPEATSDGHGCTHAREAGIAATLFPQTSVDFLIALGGSLQNLFCFSFSRAQDPVRRVQGKAKQ